MKQNIGSRICTRKLQDTEAEILNIVSEILDAVDNIIAKLSKLNGQGYVM